MFVVDSNILIYAANRNAPEFDICNAALEKWRRQSGRWHLTWSVCFEFMRAVTHRATLERPWSLAEAWSFLDNLRQSPGLRILAPTENFAAAFAETITTARYLSGSDVHDAGIAAVMKEHGVRTIYTHDRGFHRFPFLEVIDPIAVG